MKDRISVRQVVRLRAAVLSAIRAWFQRAGFLEVETPLAYRYAAADPHIQSVCLTINSSGRRSLLFLQTSPESCMKQLLADGVGNIYQICKAFRDDENSELHNPEFTILEFYRVGADYCLLMDDLESLVKFVCRAVRGTESIMREGRELDISGTWPRVRIRDLFLQCVGVDVLGDAAVGDLRNFAIVRGYPGAEAESFDSLFHHVFVQEIEPQLARYAAVFIHDYPYEFGAMARTSPGDPRVAERCELYVAGLELANGYSELVDPAEQRRRLVRDMEKRRANGKPVYEIDEGLLSALKRGLPECAGAALGVDRLAMLLANACRISDVIPFSFERQFSSAQA